MKLSATGAPTGNPRNIRDTFADANTVDAAFAADVVSRAAGGRVRRRATYVFLFTVSSLIFSFISLEVAFGACCVFLER